MTKILFFRYDLHRTTAEYERRSYEHGITDPFGSLNTGFEMDFSKVVIANGALDLPFNPSASAEGTTLTFTWADNSGIGTAKASDNIYAAIYNKEQEQVIYSLVAARSARTGTVTIPTLWSGDSIDVWIYVRAEAARNESKKYSVSSSEYIGSFVL